jgi:outer membrane protein
LRLGKEFVMKIIHVSRHWGRTFRIGTLALCVLATIQVWDPLPWTFAQQKPQEPSTTSTSLSLVSPIERAEKEGTALKISLKELTKLALQNNLDIAISETNEALYQQRVTQTYGFYDPLVNVAAATGRSKSANTNITNRSATGFNQRDTANWNFSITQNVPTGGAITANFNSSRSDTNQLATLFTPQFQANTQIQVTQPLWRNFRIDLTRSNIKLYNLDLKSNDSKFRQGVTATIASIQALYWDLVGAIRDYDIKKQSVELARLQVDQNRAKVEIGTLASITVTEALATQATREIDLIRARETILSTENALRNMISSDRNSDIWHQTIVPSDSPDFRDYQVKLEEATNTALRNRPELEQYDLQLQQNDITLRMQKNTKKWQFDVIGTFGANGTAGPQSFSTTGVPSIPVQFVGGVPTAYKTIFTEKLFNWNVAFNVQIPIKSRTVDSQLAQTQIAKQQLIMNRTKAEQNVIVQIRNAVEAMETSRQRVETSKVSLRFAQEQLDGETQRFEAGMSQNFQVLQRQADLSTAQGTALQALIAYKKAVINLQQNMYNLLEANDFEIAKSPGKNAATFK